MNISSDYINQTFKINQFTSDVPLCTGIITAYLGARDGYEYFKADITITYSGANRFVLREVAFKDGDFYMQGALDNSMKNYTNSFEWTAA